MSDCEILIKREFAEILEIAAGSLHFGRTFGIVHPERDLMALAELYGKRCTPRTCSKNGYFFQCKLLSGLVNTWVKPLAFEYGPALSWQNDHSPQTPVA